MDTWLLAGSTIMVVLGGGLGLLALQRGQRSAWTLVCMMAAFALQLAFLGKRGEARGACPLGDYGEILAFLAWSLVLFYLLIGPTYRLSLLGMFTAPVVATFQLIALIPGMMAADPVRKEVVNAWGEAHSAFSVLAYGAFALAAVAGLMFLVLNRQLKDQHLNTGLFRNLPPVRTLSISVVRLTMLGVVILTVGMVSGFLMEREAGGDAHLVAAVMIWCGYVGLLVFYFWRGVTPRRLSHWVIALFVLSLVVFALV
jgi:ABC-type uncharacterized transport system permease subunit